MPPALDFSHTLATARRRRSAQSANRWQYVLTKAATLLGCVGALLFSLSPRANGANVKKVLGGGDPVEGLPGITVQLVTQAKLTGDGRVVAIVWLQGPGVVVENREAIVSVVPGGPVQLWGRSGDPALGDGVPAGSTIANFGSTSSSSPLEASDTGIVAKLMEINIPGVAFKSRAVVAGGMGSLRIEVYDDKPWPAIGAGVKLRTGSEPRVSRTGEVAFLTSASGSGPNAVWKGPPGSVAVVAQDDVAYPGLPGFGMFETLQQPAINEAGEVSFYGQLRKDFPPFPQTPIVSDANRDRLWQAGPPFVELVNSGAEVAGGGTLGGLLQSWAFSGPWSYFTASHRQPARTDTVVAVVQAGSPPQIVLHPQRPAPDAAGGTLAPFSFVSQLDTTLVANGVLITNQRLLIGGAVTTSNDQGIWRWDGSFLRLLAREGAEVPGLPGRHWSSLTTGIAVPSGHGVFSAGVPEQGSPSSPTKRNWTGLWGGASAESLALLLEDGGPIDLGGGALGTIHSLGRVRSANETHLLVDIQYRVDNGSAVNGLGLFDPAAPPPKGSLTGAVRLDYDQDGNLADTEDLPVSGILCELLARDASGAPVGPVLQTSTTGDTGTYGFTDVPLGAYVVRATLDAGQQSLGVVWTWPPPSSPGTATVSRNADVNGSPTASLDFLITTPIRPDKFTDGNDGNVGPGQQSLREALDRATLRSRLLLQDRVIELSAGTYLLDAPLVFEPIGAVPKIITLSAPAARPLLTSLSGQDKTRIMEIRAGAWVKTEWLAFETGKTDGEGGAVKQQGLSFEAFHCAFLRCSASTKGGAVANLAGSTALRTCYLIGNKSNHRGGALFCGGAAGTSVVVEDSIFLNNSTDGDGGAIAVEGGELRLVRNNVIQSKAALAGPGVFVASSAPPPFLYSCLLQGGAGRLNSGGYNLIETPDNLVLTAQFGDLIGVDPGLEEGGKLQADSLAINAGDPRFGPSSLPDDIQGNPRVVGGRIDIGALEFQGTPDRTTGGLVHLDYDQDGDPMETDELDNPFPGIGFELLARDAAGNPTGPVLMTSTSDTNGAYSFKNVPQGAFVVRATLTPDQQAMGLSWTLPRTTTATATLALNVPGPTSPTGFLVTSALRPDNTTGDGEKTYPDAADGDVGPGKQSLREAVHRALRISMARQARVDVDLNPGVYLLDSPLVIGADGRVRLRGAAAGQVLDGQSKKRIIEISPGCALDMEWIILRNGQSTLESGRGGAVQNKGELYARFCVFESSSSESDGGAVANATGAVARFASCEFIDNRASLNGGAIWCGARRDSDDAQTGITLSDTIIRLNTALGRGGAVSTDGGRVTLERSSLLWNNARLEGGGLMIFGGIVRTFNSLFTGNTVVQEASAEDGSGPLQSDGYNWFDAPRRLVMSGAGISTDHAGVSAGVPLKSLRLSPDSPLINAGDPTITPATPGVPDTDALGNPRITGGRIDIGAVEFEGTPTDWALAFFGEAVANNPDLKETVYGPTADPDQDGLPNVLERALGGDPTSSSQSRADGTPILPQVARTTGGAVGGFRDADDDGEALAFTFALDERYTDLRYAVQTSEDEKLWATAATYTPLGTGLGFRREATPDSLTSPGGSSATRFRHTVIETTPITPGTRLFLRLRVTSQD